MTMNKLGLGFVGCVKTATKLFPNCTLQNVQLNGCGNYFEMMAMDKGVKLLAFT